MRAAVYGDDTGAPPRKDGARGRRAARPGGAALLRDGAAHARRGRRLAPAEHGVEDAPLHWYALRAAARIAHTPECGLWKRDAHRLRGAARGGRADAGRGARRAPAPLPRGVRAGDGGRLRGLDGPAPPGRARRGRGGRARSSATPTSRGASSSTSPARRCLRRTRPRRPGSSRAGTTRSSPTPTARGSSRRGRRLALDDAGADYQVFLVDGFAAGSWRLERGKVVLAPYARLSRAARADLATESTAWRARRRAYARAEEPCRKQEARPRAQGSGSRPRAT